MSKEESVGTIFDKAEEIAKFEQWLENDREITGENGIDPVVKKACETAWIAAKLDAWLSPATANKVAEEGEGMRDEYKLPALPEESEWDVDAGGGYNTSTYGYTADDMQAYARQAIAADRASRQVANKAEVEPVTQVHLSDSNWMDVPISEVPTWKRKGFETRTLYATPPATTGASTVRDQVLEDAAEAIDAMNDASGDAAAYDGREQNLYELEREHAISACADKVRSLKGACSARIVLTDQLSGFQPGQWWIEELSKLTTMAEPTADMVRAVAVARRFTKLVFEAREVAAQAGQVAVAGWISVDDRLPPNEELPNGDWPSVLALWKEDALADGLVDQMVTNTAYFCKNLQNFTHWMPLPAAPSPAKESK